VKLANYFAIRNHLRYLVAQLYDTADQPSATDRVLVSDKSQTERINPNVKNLWRS